MMKMIPNRCSKTAATCLVLALSAAIALMSGCGQSGAHRQHAHSAMAASVHQQWAGRLAGTWVRVDNQDDVYEASGAPTLKINATNFHEAWSDGTTRDSRWIVVQDDRDVVHIALEAKDRAPEVWRLYLYSPQELTAFALGLPPATYKRRGTEHVELSTQMQAAKQAQVSSAQEEPQQATPPLPPPSEGEPLRVATDANSTGATPHAQVSQASNRVETAPQEQHVDETPRKKPSHQELEAIFQQIQHIHDTMTPADRALGERLLIGTWDLTQESLTAVNAMRGNGVALFEGAVLNFGARQRLSMIWKTATDTLSDGLRWEIEGMYGPELRVILSESGQQPSRERMKFLSADHFILDPGGANLHFERRTQ